VPIDAIAFDVNGTLLDLSALDSHFLRLFGESNAREQWFQQLQILWMASIPCDTWQPFDKLAKAALQMLAETQALKLSSVDQKLILQTMTQLPPFVDVREALERLKRKYRLAPLTNGALRSAKAQLKHARLIDLFEEVFSADQVERYKPAPEPYQFAAKQLRLKPKNILFVAAHGWDTEGAANVKMRTAFVARPGEVLNPLGKKPDYVAKNLLDLADQLT
jgi:2-haloacid dehalogenase